MRQARYWFRSRIFVVWLFFASMLIATGNQASDLEHKAHRQAAGSLTACDKKATHHKAQSANEDIDLTQNQKTAIIAGISTFLIPAVVLLWLRRRPESSGEGRDHTKADYTIPYCKFEKTPDGFKVSYRRWPQSLLALGVGSYTPAFAFFLPIFLIAGFSILVWQAFFPTTIQVTGEHVIVNGKKFARADFGMFVIGKTFKYRGYHGTAACVLEFAFGRRRFPLGGVWREDEANYFLSALNNDIRIVPKGGELHVSPEALRTARPTDF